MKKASKLGEGVFKVKVGEGVFTVTGNIINFSSCFSDSFLQFWIIFDNFSALLIENVWPYYTVQDARSSPC